MYFYEADGLGSVTSLTDQTGALAATYTYDSFGNMTHLTGNATNWFRYTGREDEGNGLYYYRARYYDTQSGRFISEDPDGFRGGNDFYAYTPDNPTSMLDSDGRLTQLAIGGPKLGSYNPFGHAAIIINGVVYSYDTTYASNGDMGDWGASASAYLAAQNGLRQTSLLTLNLTPQQEAQLQKELNAYNPFSNDYSLAGHGHTCVTVIEDNLKNVGVLPSVPAPIRATPQGDLQAGAPSVDTPQGLGDWARSLGLVQSETSVGQAPGWFIWVKSLF